MAGDKVVAIVGGIRSRAGGTEMLGEEARKRRRGRLAGPGEGWRRRGGLEDEAAGTGWHEVGEGGGTLPAAGERAEAIGAAEIGDGGQPGGD